MKTSVAFMKKLKIDLKKLFETRKKIYLVVGKQTLDNAPGHYSLNKQKVANVRETFTGNSCGQFFPLSCELFDIYFLSYQLKLPALLS